MNALTNIVASWTVKQIFFTEISQKSWNPKITQSNRKNRKRENIFKRQKRAFVSLSKNNDCLSFTECCPERFATFSDLWQLLKARHQSARSWVLKQYVIYRDQGKQVAWRPNFCYSYILTFIVTGRRFNWKYFSSFSKGKLETHFSS